MYVFPHQEKQNAQRVRCPPPITAVTLCIILAARDSLMVEMKSRKHSFGKRGFSRPLKYSLSTPATELISCSFWSSVRGSSPVRESGSDPQRDGNVVFLLKTRAAAARDSPLSNEFLMSLTSTCDPGTRKMPCCCRPERKTNQNSGVRGATAIIITLQRSRFQMGPLKTQTTLQEM